MPHPALKRPHKHRSTEVYYYEAPPPPPPPSRLKRLANLPAARRDTLQRVPFYLFVALVPLFLPQYLRRNADPAFMAGPTVLRAGQTLAIRADKADNRHTYYFSLDGANYGTFQPDDTGLPRGLLPLKLETRPGLHTLAVRQHLYNKTVFATSVFVKSGVTGAIRLRLPKARRKKILGKTAELRAAKKAFGAAFDDKTKRQLWRGTFILPVPGRFSSPHGQLRLLPNGKKTFHRGQDIATPVGTPVLAANTGLVTLAARYPLQGNLVVLAHGQEVYSLYEHLDTILVEEGTLLQKGRQLGTSGNTGYSTGPHLHWGIMARGVLVDPVQWLSKEF